jgi:hypothetical protein
VRDTLGAPWTKRKREREREGEGGGGRGRERREGRSENIPGYL